jgi:hypothetical protein
MEMAVYRDHTNQRLSFSVRYANSVEKRHQIIWKLTILRVGLRVGNQPSPGGSLVLGLRQTVISCGGIVSALPTAL